MVWLQIILFSVASGIVLFFINKTDSIKSRNIYYLIFVIIFSVSITVTFGLQARIDTSSIMFGYILPGAIFSIILCSEAIFSSIFISKYTNIKSIFLYLPIFLLILWPMYFMTILILASFYPGS